MMPTADLIEPYVLHTYNNLRWMEKEETRHRLREMADRVCLITQYFSGRNAEAQQAAIQFNALNPLVGEIYLLQETDEFRPLFSTFANADKIDYIVIGKHLQFSDAIGVANTNITTLMKRIQQPLIAMVVNSDIVADLSLVNLHAMLHPDWDRSVMFISRKRTYIDGTPIDDVNLRDQCALFQGSADGFAFVPPLVSDDDSLFDMYLGEFGVEGRFNFETQRLGWKGLNPCRFVGLYHYHIEKTSDRDARRAATSLKINRHPTRSTMTPGPIDSLPARL